MTQLDLRLYWPGPDGNWQERQSGERVAHREGRDHDFRHMLFRLPTLDQNPTTFTCAAMTRRQLISHARLATGRFEPESGGRKHCLGVIYGIIAALLLYNLFIFCSLRDSAYFWYVLTTAGALLMILSMSGHGFQYLWPDNPVPFWLTASPYPRSGASAPRAFTQCLMQTRTICAGPITC